MNHFCKQASRLLSDRYERRLTAGEQTRLRLHLLICGMCRNYSQSLALLHRLLGEVGEHPPIMPLPEAARQHILQQLESERHGSAD